MLDDFEDLEGTDITLSFTVNGNDPLPGWVTTKTQGGIPLLEFGPSADHMADHVINVLVEAETG